MPAIIKQPYELLFRCNDDGTFVGAHFRWRERVEIDGHIVLGAFHTEALAPGSPGLAEMAPWVNAALGAQLAAAQSTLAAEMKAHFETREAHAAAIVDGRAHADRANAAERRNKKLGDAHTRLRNVSAHHAAVEARLKREHPDAAARLHEIAKEVSAEAAERKTAARAAASEAPADDDRDLT